MKNKKIVIAIPIVALIFTILTMTMFSMKTDISNSSISEIDSPIINENMDIPILNTSEICKFDSKGDDKINIQEEQTDYVNRKISPFQYLEYINDELYEIIKDEYSKVEFFGEFKKGNPETYDFYKNQYLKLLNKERTIIDNDTKEEVYINELRELEDIINFADNSLDLIYYFFDIDEDNIQELVISHKYRAFYYILKYRKNIDKFILWDRIEVGRMHIIGSRKMSWHIPDFRFYQLDENANTEYSLSIYCYDYFDIIEKQLKDIYMVSLPQYTDESKNIKLSDDHNYKSYCDGETVYFRVSEEQLDELTKDFFESQKLAEKNIKEVTFTYEELFGVKESDETKFQENKSNSSAHKVSRFQYFEYINDELYELIKDGYSKVEFFGEFKKGNSETYNFYKKKYLKLLKREATFIDNNTKEELYIDELSGLEGITNFADDSLDLIYYFFDIDEDNFQELVISYQGGYGGYYYVIKYDTYLEKFILWRKIELKRIRFIGSKKLAWSIPYFGFYQLDNNGDIECDLLIYRHDYYDIIDEQYKYICMVTLPRFADENNNIKLPENIEYKTYDYYGDIYFRVSEEQYRELTKDFFDSQKLAEENIKEVTFTYAELFGSD